MMQGMDAWTPSFDYLLRNWHTLVQAPLVFVAAIVLALVAAKLWFAREISTLKTTIDSLKTRNGILEKQVTDKFQVNTQQIALEIVVGSGPDFIEFERLSPFQTRCELFVLITNIGNGLLSDFIVQVTETQPPIGNLPRTAALANTLLPGEPRRVKVATYFNSTTNDGNGAPLLRFAEYYHGGYGHNFFRFDPVGLPRAESPLLFTVKAKARQCNAAEARMRFFVEDGGRLKAIADS